MSAAEACQWTMRGIVSDVGATRRMVPTSQAARGAVPAADLLWPPVRRVCKGLTIVGEPAQEGRRLDVDCERRTCGPAR